MPVPPARFADAPLPAKSRSARLLWAMLMSLFTAGLGHVYLGRFRPGLMLVALDVAIDLAGTALMHRPPSPAALELIGLVLVAVLALRIASVVLVARAGAPTQSLRKPVIWQNAWVIFLLVLGVTQAASHAQPVALRSFSIPSGSMQPTLQIGDLLMADSTPRAPERGEIVFFTAPSDPDLIYVKRVVALGGDHVRLDHGTVILNGRALPRGDATETNLDGRAYTVTATPGPLDTTDEITVPTGEMFVLGDNRANSRDSRDPSVGTVNLGRIVAQGGVIYWAQNRSRILSEVH